MAMSNKQKIKIGIFASVVLFFIATFSKNWGTAVANVGVEKYTSIVKSYKNDPQIAKQNCPKIIKNLEEGIADLEKNGFKDKIMLSNKLIADCEFYSESYKKAAESYKKLIKVEPQVARWHFRTAESLFKSGAIAEALPVVHLATQLDVQNKAEIWLLKGQIQTALHLPNNAIESYQMVLKSGSFEQIKQAETAIHELTKQ